MNATAITDAESFTGRHRVAVPGLGGKSRPRGRKLPMLPPWEIAVRAASVPRAVSGRVDARIACESHWKR
jgi:hypothetical protein